MLSQTVHAVAAFVGFTSLALLWTAVVLGLVVRNGWASTRLRYSTVEAAHMTAATLGLTLAVVHAAAQLASPGGIVRLVDEVVPFINPSDPVGVGAGTVALELFLASALSVPIRKKLGHGRWRAVHALTYGAFILVSGHVLISGSDVGPPWVWASVLAGCATVVVLWVATTPLVGRLRGRVVRRSVERSQAQSLVVDVDAARCQRFGFCEHEAPEFFRLQGSGRLAYRTHVPAAGAENVIRAVEVCPARAIALRRLPTTIVTGSTGPIPAAPDGPPVPRPSDPRSPEPRRSLRSGGVPIFPAGVETSTGHSGGLPVVPVGAGDGVRSSRKARNTGRGRAR
ncbi:MAG: ferric reductase-like transmembrane domain-containing protein [Kineosporiaceae bacterium]